MDCYCVVGAEELVRVATLNDIPVALHAVWLSNCSPPGAMAPYRLRLDNGQKIFAPHDVDEVVRKPTGEGTVIESAPGL